LTSNSSFGTEVAQSLSL